MKNRIYSCILAGLITCTLMGCGGNASTSAPATDSKPEAVTETDTATDDSKGDSQTGETPDADTQNDETPATNTQTGEQQDSTDATCSLSELYSQICSSVELVSPMELPQEYIENYYAIDLNKLEDYVFSIAEESTSAETIVIMKLKDASDSDSIVESIQLVVDEKKGEMENYLPEQYDLVARSTIQTKGSYVWLVISAHDKEINQIITDTIK